MRRRKPQVGTNTDLVASAFRLEVSNPRPSPKVKPTRRSPSWRSSLGSLSDTATSVTVAGAVAVDGRAMRTGTAIDSPVFTATSGALKRGGPPWAIDRNREAIDVAGQIRRSSRVGRMRRGCDDGCSAAGVRQRHEGRRSRNRAAAGASAVTPRACGPAPSSDRTPTTYESTPWASSAVDHVEVQAVRLVLPLVLAARAEAGVEQRVVQLPVVGDRPHHALAVRPHEVEPA